MKRAKKKSPTQLDRIENGVRFLVDAVGWPNRCAWDGYRGKELEDAIAGEDAARVRGVENVMNFGKPLP